MYDARKPAPTSTIFRGEDVELEDVALVASVLAWRFALVAMLLGTIAIRE
jgi:hypothetical protein